MRHQLKKMVVLVHPYNIPAQISPFSATAPVRRSRRSAVKATPSPCWRTACSATTWPAWRSSRYFLLLNRGHAFRGECFTREIHLRILLKKIWITWRFSKHFRDFLIWIIPKTFLQSFFKVRDEQFTHNTAVHRLKLVSPVSALAHKHL